MTDKEFTKHLQKLEDPKNNQGVNYDLSENSSLLQISKYKICKKILAFQMKNRLDDEWLVKKLDLSLAEVEEILYCQIEKFTLDRLMVYAGKLFSPQHLEIIIREKPEPINVRNS